MATPNFEELLERVKYLPPDEQKILRDHLDACLASPLPPSKDAYEEALRRGMAAGSITRIPDPPTEEDIARFRNWKPITIEGEPLSETIIRER